MQIVLHIGPHKTGTTSIQQYLKAHFGSHRPSASNWYPMPAERGPGHSILACDLFDNDGTALLEVIRQADLMGTDRLLISAEAFDRFYRRRMDRLVKTMDGHPLHLLVTLNSPIVRAASSWQESVKHGNPSDFNDWWPTLLKLPGYQPDFLRRYPEALGPSRISVVFSDRARPAEELLFNVLEALMLPISSRERMGCRANVRLEYIECEVLRRLNELLREYGTELTKPEKHTLPESIIDLMHSKQWEDLCPAVPIQLPSPILNELAEMAQRTVDDIDELTKHWPVSIHGEREVMLGVEDTATK